MSRLCTLTRILSDRGRNLPSPVFYPATRAS